MEQTRWDTEEEAIVEAKARQNDFIDKMCPVYKTRCMSTECASFRTYMITKRNSFDNSTKTYLPSWVIYQNGCMSPMVTGFIECDPG